MVSNSVSAWILSLITWRYCLCVQLFFIKNCLKSQNSNNITSTGRFSDLINFIEKFLWAGFETSLYLFRGFRVSPALKMCLVCDCSAM